MALSGARRSLARSLARLAVSSATRGAAPVLSTPRLMHGLGRDLRWQQSQSPGPLECDIAPLPLPPLSRQWFFASEEDSAPVAAVYDIQVVPATPPRANGSQGLSLASTLKKRVTKMNKHKRRKRRKRDRLKKRTK